MRAYLIRHAEPGDGAAITALALDKGTFEPEEVAVFEEVLQGFHSGDLADHTWLVATDAGRVVAAAYYAPEPFSDRMWNLYFLATSPAAHATGARSTLLARLESDLTSRGSLIARTLIVDTSSLDQYESARRFYERRGFVEEARLREFYGPSDHKVVRKQLAD